MPVYVGSRYSGCKFTGILGKDGKARKFLHPREPMTPLDVKEPFLAHDFQFGEVIDALAHSAARKPRLWWMVADVNEMLFPLDVEAGASLIIPVRELMGRLEFG